MIYNNTVINVRPKRDSSPYLITNSKIMHLPPSFTTNDIQQPKTMKNRYDVLTFEIINTIFFYE